MTHEEIIESMNAMDALLEVEYQAIEAYLALISETRTQQDAVAIAMGAIRTMRQCLDQAEKQIGDGKDE